MDCQTAGQLLPYLNPRAEPLPTELARELEAHASDCPTCSALLQNTGREDRVIALAMRDVEVPDGLHDRLLARLRRERIRRRRNWPVRHPRWAAAAAVLLCFVAGAFGYWWQRPLPSIDMNTLEITSQLPAGQQVAALLRERGLRFAPPSVLRYNFMISCGSELFQGKLVPKLLFEGNGGQIAEVFILTSRDFDLASTPEASGNLVLDKDPFDKNIRYLVRFTGASRDWIFNSVPGA
jgi:hypothetical protein